MTTKLLETLTLAEEAFNAINLAYGTYESPTIKKALSAIREQKAELENEEAPPANLREAVYAVIEGHDISSYTRKFLADAYYAAPQPVKQVPVGKVLLHEGDVNAKGYLYNPLPEGTDLYAAPVQQVDLTDGEIAKALGFNIMLVTTKELKDARAVIAADREKNK